MPEFRAGQVIPLRNKNWEIKATIIDPKAWGQINPLSGWAVEGWIVILQYPSKLSLTG